MPNERPREAGVHNNTVIKRQCKDTTAKLERGKCVAFVRVAAWAVTRIRVNTRAIGGAHKQA